MILAKLNLLFHLKPVDANVITQLQHVLYNTCPILYTYISKSDHRSAVLMTVVSCSETPSLSDLLNSFQGMYIEVLLPHDIGKYHFTSNPSTYPNLSGVLSPGPTI